MRQYALSLLFILTLYTPSVAVDYFWIGGAGNWSDISHWSTTSGGIITHDQVPTADDDVYFDTNSFTGPGQEVIINNENIFCRNLNWSGATGFPSFTGDAAKVIHIFGALQLIPAMDFNFSGQIRFRAANADTPLQTAGLPLGNSVFFVGDGGWILQDSLVVDSLILLENGHFNTNSFSIQAGYLYTDIQNSGSLSLGNSKITLHGQNIYQAIGDEFFAHFVLQFWSNDRPFTIDPGTSQIELTASDAQVDIQVNAPLQLHDLLFSNAAGTGRISLFFAAPLRFETLTFSNNGDIWGEVGGQQLVLTAGKFYDFAAGFSYPFDQILAPGSCLANITLQGNETGFGQTAEFKSDGQNIVLEYVNLKNTTATGTSSFVANNSVDLGNTAGWTINSRSVQNLYWVGGDGNWNDPNHWSLTSGGVGGACIPSGTDNVFFDTNSFTANNQSVIITEENIFCRDMTWTGAGFFPSFEGGYDPILHIFGSLTLIPEMNYRFGGLVKFESQEIGKTITSGNQLINKIEFNSTQGEWTLLDSLRSETFILLNAGSLLTNDQYVECTEFSNGNTGLSRRLTLGNTHWVIKHFPGARKDVWFVELANFELNAGTSTIEFVGIGGYFEHTGTGNVNYHKLIFNNEVGYLHNFATTVDCTIDSLQFNHGGYIQSDYQINTLILRPGFTYLFKENTTQTLGEIVAPGDCNQLITLKSDATGNAAFFAAFNPQTDLQYLSIRDIHSIGAGNLAAQNSIDLANNTGWVIEELGNRTLYWVGGNGDWGDPAHWALSSGGVGGQCVPTLRDDVFFDLNSFSGPNQTIIGQSLNGYYCRNITWSNGLPDPQFNLNRLYCHGSASFSPNMTNQLTHFHMSGEGTQTTLYNKQQLNFVYLDGTGTYTFLDALTAEELILRSGGWNANDQSIALERWRMQNQNTNLNLLLGQAYIKINGAFDNLNHSLEAPFGAQTSIDPGASIVEITHSFASAYLSGGLQFHNVIFSGTDGQLQVSHPANSSSLTNPARFNLLEFGGDAIIKGYHSTDTLIFAPGKSYQLEYQVTQTVNEHLYVLGNNCNPIALFSTLPGEKATIFLPTATVIGDFIQMRDQIATGGATVYAGVHSTDIDNSNQGWIFEGSPSFTDVGFFGLDQTICSGDVLQLSAYNYSPGETYEWSTGSLNESITVTDAGNYWARVTFGNMCEIIDTIQINTIEPALVDLGPDRAICEGESMLLEAETNDPSISYLWQDGSTDSSFESTQAGTYFVTLNKQGCLSSDTLILDLLPSPTIDLGADQSACQGESISLDATINQTATYLWQDGSTSPTLSATQSGNYAVSVTANGCSGQDEINITFNAIPSFSLGPDTSLCSGQSLSFNFANLGDSYLWQDGTTDNTNTIDQAGLFWLQVQANGCSARDTILIDLFQTPTIDLGKDQTLCENETLLLEVMLEDYDDFYWQDGNSQPQLRVDQSGIYWVEAVLGSCRQRDSIQVIIREPIELGLPDTILLCAGQTQILRPKVPAGSLIIWQDGTTNDSYPVTKEGVYSLMVDDGICLTNATLEVFSSSCGQIPVYIPTIFSPNDDGLNDSFAPNFDASYPVIDYELQVFDRWGGLVFSSNNPKEGWPGTVRSRPASEGVYVYLLRFQFEDQGETFVQNLAGDISLIR